MRITRASPASRLLITMHEDYLGVPGVAAAAYNEDYLSAPGVRFVPTDQELIVDYLGRKLRGESLPTGVVHDGHNAYAEHPKKLGESSPTRLDAANLFRPSLLALNHLRLLSYSAEAG